MCLVQIQLYFYTIFLKLKKYNNVYNSFIIANAFYEHEILLFILYFLLHDYIQFLITKNKKFAKISTCDNYLHSKQPSLTRFLFNFFKHNFLIHFS